MESLARLRARPAVQPDEVPDVALLESDYEGTADNLRNGLEAIRSRKTPNVSIRIGVEAARAAHIGNAALRSGKRVTWDEQQQKII